ncbi:hypothetical protein PVAP13_3KG373827 [Panicum virgatum]|uniref:Uncharacterized protein n=1 Tax=Panicum virgatum TaxID=38727 RepID=A0A8T0UQJ5_PANVG|nr:hypothetical protein PVAP13_3KG373827 [Panicum virgatum]
MVKSNCPVLLSPHFTGHAAACLRAFLRNHPSLFLKLHRSPSTHPHPPSPPLLPRVVALPHPPPPVPRAAPRSRRRPSLPPSPRRSSPPDPARAAAAGAAAAGPAGHPTLSSGADADMDSMTCSEERPLRQPSWV